jgi:hypothetical protein
MRRPYYRRQPARCVASYLAKNNPAFEGDEENVMSTIRYLVGKCIRDMEKDSTQICSWSTGCIHVVLSPFSDEIDITCHPIGEQGPRRPDDWDKMDARNHEVIQEEI